MVTKILTSTKNRSDIELKADLVSFWSRHPHAKFTLGVVVGTLGYKKRADIEKALESMVKASLLEKHINRGLPFYRLTTNVEKRGMILSQTA